MAQPLGFIDERYPHHVSQLRRSIYGLKQKPRAWYQRLSTFLLEIGFVGSKTDTSLFIFRKAGLTIYILVYVDDIIVTGNQPIALTSLLSRPGKEFAIKDLGHLDFFLGIEVVATASGLHLS